jgi:hypothetical protein
MDVGCRGEISGQGQGSKKSLAIIDGTEIIRALQEFPNQFSFTRAVVNVLSKDASVSSRPRFPADHANRIYLEQ